MVIVSVGVVPRGVVTQVGVFVVGRLDVQALAISYNRQDFVGGGRL